MSFASIVRAFAALLLALPFGAQAADQATAALRIRVVVEPYFVLRVLSQPGAVEVTEADVARGYVDAPVPLRLGVASNTRDLYGIQFERGGEHFRAASVEGMGQQVRVASQGVMTWRPDAQTSTLEFRVRLQLAPELRPGRYPWPLQFSVNRA